MSAGDKTGELRLRIISASVLVTVAVVTTLLGGWTFETLWFCAAAACYHEWSTITQGSISKPAFALMLLLLLAISVWPAIPFVWLVSMVTVAGGGIVASTAVGRRWALPGALYAAGLLLSVVALRRSPEHGMAAIFFLYAVVWTADIAAYFTGRAIGGPKLAPGISPGKTWSGFAGGTVGGSLAGAAALIGFGQSVAWQHLVLAAVLSVASAAGDLAESALKRNFGVKDSGRLIPGHGGILDRLDGFVAVALCALIIGSARDTDPARGLLLW